MLRHGLKSGVFRITVALVCRLGMTLTFQALSDEDRRLWLDAMDGKEPVSFLRDFLSLCVHITDAFVL